jgi:hypothetical protein
MKSLTLALLLVFNVGQALGQVPTEKVIIDQTQFWISTNNVYRYSNKMGILTDFHIRKTNFLKDPNFYFARFGVRYWVFPKVTLSGGYAHMWLALPQEEGFSFLDENRLYQEILFKNKIQSTSTLFRIRTEQRWRETFDLNLDPTGNFIFNHRFRVLFSASIPFTKGDKPWNIMLADEVLFNFGDPIVYNTFDQNRLTLGLKKRINKNWSFDFGYMMVYQQLPNGYTYTLNHTLRLFFYGIFDFRKDVDPDSILMEDHAEE